MKPTAIPLNQGYTLPEMVNVYIAMENHHAINGKTHYFYGHFPVRKLWMLTISGT